MIRSFCIAAILGSLTAVGFTQTININPNNRTIAVTVTDKATAQADTATVHIGFETYAPTSDAAYAAGSRTSNAIIDALHKSGVPDKSIESEGQNLRENFQFDNDEPESERIKQRFVLTQSWTVHTSDADAKHVLNVAVQAGANNSGQIDWDVKDRAALEARAAAKALQHARAIADQMAQGLNAHLGSLLYASNQPPQPSGPEPIRMQAMAKLQMGRTVAPLAINPQQIEENATVYAVFQIQ
jgi:hypothetical protein